MPLFSIPIGELTPEMLAKAEWWAFIGRPVPARDEQPQFKCCIHLAGIRWVDGRLAHALPDDTRCFPVTLSPDGTEVRLECPRMQDEPLIAEWSDTVETTATLHSMTSTVDDLLRWRLEVSGIALTYWTLPPTPEHYPRWTLEGTWVWSTRR